MGLGPVLQTKRTPWWLSDFSVSGSNAYIGSLALGMGLAVDRVHSDRNCGAWKGLLLMPRCHSATLCVARQFIGQPASNCWGGRSEYHVGARRCPVRLIIVVGEYS